MGELSCKLSSIVDVGISILDIVVRKNTDTTIREFVSVKGILRIEYTAQRPGSDSQSQVVLKVSLEDIFGDRAKIRLERSSYATASVDLRSELPDQQRRAKSSRIADARRADAN